METTASVLCLIFMGIPEFFQFLQERINILETPVNRRKTDISHFIHFPQSCQSQLTNGFRGNFPLHGILQFCFDIGHQLFQLFHRYRTLFTGTQNTPQQIIPVKGYLNSILFNDDDGNGFHYLICSKPLLTAQTFPAPPDAFAVISGTGVHDFAFCISAKRTFHSLPSYSSLLISCSLV